MIATAIDRGSMKLSQGGRGLFIFIINNNDLWLLWLLQYFDHRVIALWSLWFFWHLNDGVITLLWLLDLPGSLGYFWGYLLFFGISLGPSSSGLIALAVG